MWYRSAKSRRTEIDCAGAKSRGLKMSDFRNVPRWISRGIPTPVCAPARNDRKSVGRAWNNGGAVVAPGVAVRLHRDVFCAEFNFSISES